MTDDNSFTSTPGGELPKVPESYWLDSVTLPAFDPLREDISVDAVVVGGGITGVTTAYLLSKSGLRVALLEAGRLLTGTTGHTTAKLTAQHSLIYDELIAHMGLSKAKLYYESNRDAIEFVAKTVEELQIDCEFKRQDAYVYSTTQKAEQQIQREWRAYESIGVSGALVDSIPFDISVMNAVIMSNQAQFHPTKYLSKLIQVAVENGVQFYEQTVAVDVEDASASPTTASGLGGVSSSDGDPAPAVVGSKPTVVTRNGQRVKATYVLACSQYPFYDGMGLYFTRLHADRAYIVAGAPATEYPGGMYISAENPTRSLRSATIEGKPVVLVVGETHKTGQGRDTLHHYRALEAFGREVFGIDRVLYRWSAQDLVTLDKVPYIGSIANGKPNVLIATGYKKWGMTTSAVAAQLLADIVLNRENPYADLYNPSRFYADPSLRTFLVQNADVAGHLIMGKLESPELEAGDVANGEGKIITYEGQRAGAYREEDGELYVVDTTCTHMGCEVSWNHGERTWDCPCHGSRFSYKGEVLNGPAKEPLKRLDLL